MKEEENMAKFDSDTLNHIRELFDNDYYIIEKGRIYKKHIAKHYHVSINGVQYKLTPELILQCTNPLKTCLLEEKTKHYFKGLDGEVLKEINNRLKTGKLIIKLDKMYQSMDSKHERGYIYFDITHKGIAYRTFAHRIIYYITCGIWDDEKVINHKDGNKSNNKIKNLELISQFENLVYYFAKEKRFSPSIVMDSKLKAKYKLTDEQYDHLKNETYNAFREYGLAHYNESHYMYSLCKDFDTPEEYVKHETEYEKKYNKLQKKNLKQSMK